MKKKLYCLALALTMIPLYAACKDDKNNDKKEPTKQNKPVPQKDDNKKEEEKKDDADTEGKDDADTEGKDDGDTEVKDEGDARCKALPAGQTKGCVTLENNIWKVFCDADGAVLNTTVKCGENQKCALDNGEPRCYEAVPTDLSCDGKNDGAYCMEAANGDSWLVNCAGGEVVADAEANINCSNTQQKCEIKDSETQCVTPDDVKPECTESDVKCVDAVRYVCAANGFYPKAGENCFAPADATATCKNNDCDFNCDNSEAIKGESSCTLPEPQGDCLGTETICDDSGSKVILKTCENKSWKTTECQAPANGTAACNTGKTDCDIDCGDNAKYNGQCFVPVKVDWANFQAFNNGGAYGRIRLPSGYSADSFQALLYCSDDLNTALKDITPLEANPIVCTTCGQNMEFGVTDITAVKDKYCAFIFQFDAYNMWAGQDYECHDQQDCPTTPKKAVGETTLNELRFVDESHNYVKEFANQ